MNFPIADTFTASLARLTGDDKKRRQTTLKAKTDADAWATLHSDISRPFPKPASGCIAVTMINHLGDELIKVFRVEIRQHAAGLTALL